MNKEELEREIIKLRNEGKSYRTIADQLNTTHGIVARIIYKNLDEITFYGPNNVFFVYIIERLYELMNTKMEFKMDATEKDIKLVKKVKEIIA